VVAADRRNIATTPRTTDRQFSLCSLLDTLNNATSHRSRTVSAKKKDVQHRAAQTSRLMPDTLAKEYSVRFKYTHPGKACAR
jgi:hypothetical protein